MTRARLEAFACVLLAHTCLATRAHAEPDRQSRAATAQALYEVALGHLDRKDYAAACPELEEVAALMPTWIGTKITLAECYEREGRLASAWATYAQAEAAATQSTNRAAEQKEAHDRMEALRPRLSRIAVHVSAAAAATAGLEVFRDDVPVGRAQWGVPLPVDPGSHTIVATARGKQRWELKVQIDAEGVIRPVNVDDLHDVASELVTPALEKRSVTMDIGFHLGPMLRLSNAPPSTERAGLSLGGAAFIAPFPRFAAGLIYEHHELGGEQTDTGTGPVSSNNQANRLDVARALDALLAGFRLHVVNTVPVQLSTLFAVGPAWQQVRGEQAEQRIGAPLKLSHCSGLDGPHLALHAELLGELLLGNGLYFSSAIALDNIRLSDADIAGCTVDGAGAPIVGPGNTLLVGGRVGFIYRFDL